MTFLKSINLVEDLAHPVRVAHYRPTSRSIEILRAVLGLDESAATAVIATYGSGKSIAAMVGGLLVEGDHAKLDQIGGAGARLAAFDPVLASRLEARCATGRKGVVVALNGFVPDLSGAVSAFLGLRPADSSMAELFASLEAHLKRRRADRLAIVWDEFGRHLETLVSRGRAEDLAQVQDLAEWTSRRKSPSATFTILLHQEFHRYAGRLGQVEQAAWKKIEGRFGALRLHEESDEIYEVIADVAADLTTSGKARVVEGMARAAMELGLFPFLSDLATATSLFRRAAPLTPAALYLLPRVGARVGQNERSTFGFLGDALPQDRSAAVGVEDLYGYFSDAMRTDAGVGGSHKRYVETEAARARAQNSVEREVLAATALLHIVSGRATGTVSRKRLAAFVALGSLHGRRVIEEAIDALLARKLLLHRQLSDDISVWQGSDVDVRARVEEEMEALRNASDDLTRIAAHVPAPVFLGSAYNHKAGLTRFAQGVFVTMGQLRSPEGQAALAAKADASDALVTLVVDGSVEDYPTVAGDWLTARPYLVLALAEQRPELDAACLRADALARLERDQDLLSMDPFVEREIKELRADALDYLASRAAALVDPDVGAVHWFSGGRCLGQGDDLHSDAAISEILSKRFPQTPRIVNEQIVRRRVSAQTKSARKRLLLGILERSRVPHMGYAGATSSDASIYRTTLVATGLYDGDALTWAEPDGSDLRLDSGTRLVWSELRRFFGEPAPEPKSFAALIEDLTAQPIGLRTGVLPILLTAGLRAFGRTLALRRQLEGRWVYLDDIQPSDMEAICETPHLFEVEVIHADELTRDIMRRLIAEFAAEPDLVETDLVRAFHDSMAAWTSALPPAALTAGGLGAEASALQRALRHTKGDPVSLLFRALPQVAGRPALDHETLTFVSTARHQIERLTRKYTEEAIEAARLAFGGGSDVLMAAKSWACRIPPQVADGSTLDRVSKGILARARRATDGRDTAASFLRALSAMLIGLDFEAWDDATARRFARELRARLREIEDAVLSLPAAGPALAPFLEVRIADYIERLKKALGPDEVRAVVARLKEGLE